MTAAVAAAPRWSATIDGAELNADVAGNAALVEALRQALQENGRDPSVKAACCEGTCGACSVLVDGERVLSCLVPAWRAAGATIETAASFADGPIPQALAAHAAVQCGFCTPGMVVALADLQRKGKVPADAAELAQWLDANLCRCTGYRQLLEAGVALLRTAA